MTLHCAFSLIFLFFRHLMPGKLKHYLRFDIKDLFVSVTYPSYTHNLFTAQLVAMWKSVYPTIKKRKNNNIYMLFANSSLQLGWVVIQVNLCGWAAHTYRNIALSHSQN